LGIRDFIEYLRKHRLVAEKPEMLSDTEREEILRQAEVMVGMADAAVKELESVVNNRRVNLPEEHALRLAQDVFLYLRDEEEGIKEKLR
jgi:phenylalanyl-tRNA synthetase alpha subunit